MMHFVRRRMRAYFLTGLVVLLPAIVSVKIFVWFLTSVDDVLKPLLERVLGRYFFGIGICLSIIIVLVVGMVAKNYFGKKLVRLVERIFDRLPFIRTIYSVVRQLIEPFSSESGKTFSQVVMVEYPMKGRYALGFLANEHVGTHEGDNLVTVFLPTNHLYLGFPVVVPERDVARLDLTVEEAVKTIMSCGIVIPKMLDLRTMKPDGAEAQAAASQADGAPALE